MAKAIKFKNNTGEYIYPCPFYPVGSIYLSINNINPSNFFGGKWEQIKDRFLLACGDKYKCGSIGGEATHTLTIEEMPRHNHPRFVAHGANGYAETIAMGNKLVQDDLADFNSIGYKGGNQAHNNMPPYLSIYIWKRIA